MSKFPPKIICAGCGIEKGEANHWHLIAYRTSSVFSYAGVNAADPSANTHQGEKRSLVITEFDLQLAEGKNQHPVCGNSCVQKLVERWLTETRVAQPPSAVSLEK